MIFVVLGASIFLSWQNYEDKQVRAIPNNDGSDDTETTEAGMFYLHRWADVGNLRFIF